MPMHPLVLQLRFTRSEFKRALKGITEAEARKRLKPMNCISWNIGHLAWQEQRYPAHLRLSPSTQHLSLLISHRREHGDTATTEAQRLAAIRG